MSQWAQRGEALVFLAISAFVAYETRAGKELNLAVVPDGDLS